jgi:predicted DNA-binding ribbon-helix-helix protein
MQSAVFKWSIVVGGRKTNVSLEDAFWNGLKEIGKDHKSSLSELVAHIDLRRQDGNLSSAIRLFVLDYYRTQVLGAFTNRAGADLQKPQDGRPPQQLHRRTAEHPV